MTFSQEDIALCERHRRLEEALQELLAFAERNWSDLPDFDEFPGPQKARAALAFDPLAS